MMFRDGIHAHFEAGLRHFVNWRINLGAFIIYLSPWGTHQPEYRFLETKKKKTKREGNTKCLQQLKSSTIPAKLTLMFGERN